MIEFMVLWFLMLGLSTGWLGWKMKDSDFCFKCACRSVAGWFVVVSIFSTLSIRVGTLGLGVCLSGASLTGDSSIEVEGLQENLGLAIALFYVLASRSCRVIGPLFVLAVERLIALGFGVSLIFQLGWMLCF